MNKDNFLTLLSLLESDFGSRVSKNESVREQHCQSLTWLNKQLPDAVIFAESTEEVSKIVKLCHQYQVPIIPFGAGSSLEGQLNAPLGGISIDVSQLNSVREIHHEDMQVVVQPGVTREQLNVDLRHTGLFFPIDPGANASLGGMASTRASGTNAVKYGTMKENVIALEVVMSDGSIIRTGNRAKKSSSGYDLTNLFVGAEGTLGIITELTLKLYPIAEHTVSGVCSFSSLEEASQTVIMANHLQIDCARIELLDVNSVKACNAYSNLTLPEQIHLFLEFHGSEAHVQNQVAQFSELYQEQTGQAFQWSSDPDKRKELWRARHDAWWAIHALYPGKVGIPTDVCVPISRLTDAIEYAQQLVESYQLNAPTIGHVGDGNFHLLIMIEQDNQADHEKVKAVVSKLNEYAIEMQGTCTGEHGIGQGKIDYMHQEHGQSLALMRLIKQSLDPLNIMNPGKLIPNKA